MLTATFEGAIAWGAQGDRARPGQLGLPEVALAFATIHVGTADRRTTTSRRARRCCSPPTGSPTARAATTSPRWPSRSARGPGSTASARTRPNRARDALEYADAHEVASYRHYLLAMRGQNLLDLGRWEAAEQDARAVLRAGEQSGDPSPSRR